MGQCDCWVATPGQWQFATGRCVAAPNMAYCSCNGKKVYFKGDAGYGGKGHYTGVGILEAPYRDGYKLIYDTWRKLVYGS